MKKAIAGAGVLALVLAAGAVYAQQNHHHMMGQFLAARVSAAEDAISATPDQRKVIDAAKDDILAKIQARKQDHKGQAAAMIDAFTADNLDTAKLYALADAHAQAIRDLAAAVVPDLQKVHDVLTPAQRQALATYLKQQHRGHGE